MSSFLGVGGVVALIQSICGGNKGETGRLDGGESGPPAQSNGFGKRVDAVDNISVLNYLVNRNLGREKEKLIETFIDIIH